MNKDMLIDALENIDSAYILQAGKSGGMLSETKQKRKKKALLRGLLIAAIIAALLVGGTFAAYQMGVFDDLWLQKPSSDPVEVVRSAIENQIDKAYTISVRVDNIYADMEETARAAAIYQNSEIADRNGWSEEYLEEHFIAVYAAYTVEYDHTKTFMRDGAVFQYFYLVQKEDSSWVIWDNSADYKLTVPIESLTDKKTEESEQEEQLETEESRKAEFTAAEQAAAAAIKGWEDFEDVRTIQIYEVKTDAEKTETALTLLSGSAFAAQRGWTEEYLQDHMLAVHAVYLIEYESLEGIPAVPPERVEEDYYLLQDSSTGEWKFSEITGFMMEQDN
ncbi:MAG: hypothetical protein ACI3V2_09790 [Faecousia sp.]